MTWLEHATCTLPERGNRAYVSELPIDISDIVVYDTYVSCGIGLCVGVSWLRFRAYVVRNPASSGTVRYSDFGLISGLIGNIGRYGYGNRKG